MYQRTRIWFVLVLVCLAAVLVTGVATAEPAKEKQEIVTLQVEGVFGGHARQGAWVPLKIDVTNRGADINGKLKVLYSNREQYLVDFVSSAVVPRGTTKRFYLDIPVYDYAGSLKVELVEGKKVLAKGKLNLTFHGPDQPVIGVMDRPLNEIDALAGVRLPNGTPPALVGLKQVNFPEAGELLGLFDVLVIDDINLQLNEKQGRALNYWIRQGGTLVIGGGPGWQKVYNGLPGELQLAAANGTQEMNLAALPGQLSKPVKDPLAGSVRVVNFSSSKGRGLFTQNGSPMAVEHIVGSGRVVCLAFDPALEPMAGWAGTRVLLQDLLFTGSSPAVSGVPVFKSAAGSKGFPGSRNPWALSEALQTIPAMKMPSLKIMAVLLLVYILLVGFISYLILKKLDKREWAWFTAPVMAFAFVGVVYAASFEHRPDDILIHQISTVDVVPGSSEAIVTTSNGVFSPGRSGYTVELEGRHIINALPTITDSMPYRPGQQPEAKIIVEQNPDRTEIQFLDMQAWAMRGFTTMGETSLGGTIRAELRAIDKKWACVVENNTQYDLTDGLVLTPFGFKKTGLLKSGGKMEVEVPAQTSGKFAPGPPFFMQAYNPSIAWQGKGRPPRPEAEDMLRNQVLEAVFNMEGPQGIGNQLFFLGWIDKPVKGTIAIPGQGIKKYYTSLFKVPVGLKTDPAALRIPPGILQGSLISSNNVGSGPVGIVYMQPNSEAVYQVVIPQGKFDNMKLNLHTGGGSGNWDGYLYDWGKQTWNSVTMRDMSIEIKDRAKYMNSNRQVRFKVVNRQDGFEVYGVSIALDSKGGDGK